MSTMKISINTDGITQSVAVASAAATRTEVLTAKIRISSLKISTIPLMGQPRYLTASQYAEAVEVVKSLKRLNALTDEDRKWCEAQGISI